MPDGWAVLGTPVGDESASVIQAVGEQPNPARPAFGLYDIAAVDAGLVGVGSSIGPVDTQGEWHRVSVHLGDAVLLRVIADGEAAIAAGQFRQGGFNGGPLVVWSNEDGTWSPRASVDDLDVATVDVARSSTVIIVVGTSGDYQVPSSVWTSAMP